VSDDRQIIKLHTIGQWRQVDPSIRQVILQHIKLKDRLQRYLLARQARQLSPLANPRYVPCRKCQQTGWLLKEPRYPGIHPSQLPHPCLLKVYKEMVGEDGQQRFEPRSLLIFDLGSAIHHMFQGYGEDGAWGPVYEKEAPINPEHQELADVLMLEGSADADNILRIDDIPNSPYIYEVGLIHEYKSINSNGFEKLTKPKPEHKMQALIYSAARDRPVVVYLYLNKDTCAMVDFPVEFEPEKWAAIEAKARRLVDHYSRGVPPPADPGFHCQDCAYALNCEANRQANQRRR
jgi:CRISPR/Cas system-associated exonuclease Cas4 (RecB family)